MNARTASHDCRHMPLEDAIERDGAIARSDIARGEQMAVEADRILRHATTRLIELHRIEETLYGEVAMKESEPVLVEG